MTPTQKHNISRGVKLAFQRKRRSLAMKASWQRRRNNNNTVEEPTSASEQATIGISQYLKNNVPDPFRQIEQLALTWKALDAHKWQVADTPQLESILDGAITQIRLEIILTCQTFIEQPQHVLD